MKSALLSLLACVLISGSMQALGQVTLTGTETEPKTEEAWTPPDLLNLPGDWLSNLQASHLGPEQIQYRLEQMTVLINERIEGLDSENQAKAKTSLLALQNNTSSFLAAVQAPPESKLPPVPSQDSFTLEEYLSLRALWRQTRHSMDRHQNELAQEKQNFRVLRDRADKLVSEYNRTDPNTPARILAALDRMASGIKWLAAGEDIARHESRLKDLKKRHGEIEEKLLFARKNLLTGDIHSSDFDFVIAAADDALARSGSSRNEVQQQLIESISEGEEVYFFSQLKLKQKLTLLSIRENLLTINQALDGVKKNWHLLREGALESVREIEQNTIDNNSLINQFQVQSERWSANSQTTLITPAPAAGSNKRSAYFSEAQEAARESLDAIRKVEDAIDDLQQVQGILSEEAVGSGLGSIGNRLSMLTSATWQRLQGIFGVKLFYIGDTPVTPGTLFRFILIILLGLVISWFIRRMLSKLQKRREQTGSSSFYTLGRLLHYLIVTVALLAAFASLGLDLGSLALIAGALSVGIGFGLQSIVNNFLSGLILLFEGSLRAGDFIELDSGVTGVVREISTRYTRINTNDNVDVVVPNSELVSFKLTNWTLKEPVVRVRIPFGVAYGTDKELVRKAALEAADEVPYTMKNAMYGRKTDVILVNFGDSSLDFQLRVWVARQAVQRPLRVKAEYYWALETKFREYGIQIPFPQRDVHMRQVPQEP